MIRRLKLNKRGDIESLFFVVIFLVIVGVLIFLFSHLNSEMFTEIESQINTTHPGTEAQIQATEFKNTNQSNVWDYAFLGIFMGGLIAIGLSAYAVRVSPAFFWIYVILGMFVLVAGVMLSNFWQGLAGDSTFSTTLTYFPITNTLLGSYFPLVVTAIIIVMMGILFAKPRSEVYE